MAAPCVPSGVSQTRAEEFRVRCWLVSPSLKRKALAAAQVDTFAWAPAWADDLRPLARRAAREHAFDERAGELRFLV